MESFLNFSSPNKIPRGFPGFQSFTKKIPEHFRFFQRCRRPVYKGLSWFVTFRRRYDSYIRFRRGTYRAARRATRWGAANKWQINRRARITSQSRWGETGRSRKLMMVPRSDRSRRLWCSPPSDRRHRAAVPLARQRHGINYSDR